MVICTKDNDKTHRQKNKPGKGSINHNIQTNKYQVRGPQINGTPGKVIGTFETYDDAKNAHDEFNRKVAAGENVEFKKRRKPGSGTIKKSHNKFQPQVPRPSGGMKNLGTFETRDEAQQILDDYFNNNKIPESNKRERGTGTIANTKNNKYLAQTPPIDGVVKSLGIYDNKADAEKVLNDYLTTKDLKLIITPVQKRKRGTGCIKKYGDKFRVETPPVDKAVKCLGTFKTYEDAETVLN